MHTSINKTLMLGKEGGNEGWNEGWRDEPRKVFGHILYLNPLLHLIGFLKTWFWVLRLVQTLLKTL